MINFHPAAKNPSVDLRVAPPGARAGSNFTPTRLDAVSLSGASLLKPKTAKGKALLVLGGLAVVAGGLATLPPAATPPPASQCTSSTWSAETNQGEMKVEVIPEQMGSIDIVRQTYTETYTDSQGETQTRTVNVDRSPIGVYLGDGLFFDTNGNLAMIPARAFGGPLVEPTQGKTLLEPDGWLNDITIDRQGSEVKVDAQGFGVLNSIKVTEGTEQTKIDPWGLGKWNSITITRHGNQTTIDPHGFGSWDAITITRDGNNLRVTEPGWFWNHTNITKTENAYRIDPDGPLNSTSAFFCGDQVTMDSNGILNTITIKNHNGTLEISHPGPWNDATVTRTDKGVRIDGSGFLDNAVIRHE
ncbi:MAG: hypothetical protein KC910_00585 [Candidatus Eremiobacteraeota bacterium]|nr:hypothetical protein [Candidatus Eremiobacteraeota bacterium]